MILKDIEKLRNERNVLQADIQNELNSALTYTDKLIKIYKILFRSQVYYSVYKNADVFGEDKLEELITKLSMVDNLNDLSFYVFVNDNLIKPLNSGHVSLSFGNEYIDGFIELYSFLKTKCNENNEVRKFVENNKLEYLLGELLKIGDLNEQSFEQFLEKSVFTVISKDEIIRLKTSKGENLKVDFLGDTVVISLKSFSRKHLENDRAKLEELKKTFEYGDFKNVIIDIRGNSGGTDEYFEYFDFLSDKDIYHTSSWHNLFTGENESVKWEAIPKGTDKRYNRYLLVDNKVFSTAQCFTQMCQQNNFATVVGEKTLGEGDGLTPLTIQLNTSVPMYIRFPIEAPVNDFGSIDYINCYNTNPDVNCRGTDALNVAFDLINHEYGYQTNFENGGSRLTMKPSQNYSDNKGVVNFKVLTIVTIISSLLVFLISLIIVTYKVNT